MTLWKRGGVYWTYVWANGVRHAKSTQTNKRRLAQKIDEQYKEELLLGEAHPNRLKPDMTFGELAARFLAEVGPRPYHVERLKLLLPFFADIPIGQITRATAREYRKHRHDKKKQLSETTVNRDLEVLRHLLFWAADEGYLPANPLSRMPMVRERRKVRGVMSLDEEAKLLSDATGHLSLLIIWALDTGMRRGELLTQRWEHIDLGRRIVAVTHSKTAEGEAREIPLTTRLFELLKASSRSGGLVFQFKGHAIHSVKTAWKTAITKAGIRYFRFHDLRHTFNTRLMEAGVLQDVRKALMGHSSGEDVHSIYTHVELPAKREAIRKLQGWVEEQKKLLAEKQQKEKEERDERSPIANNRGNSDALVSES